MKTFIKRIYLVLIIIFLLETNQSSANDGAVVFGEVSLEELKMDFYEGDPDASAVILSDIGESYITNMSAINSVEMNIERHVRIKILSENGYGYANFKIPVIVATSEARESFEYIKASTFNLENGEIVETKLDKGNIYDQEVSKYYYSKNFAMPNVKVGSVIDICYKIRSTAFIHLRDWQFQYSIPVLHSEYSVAYPDFFIYRTNLRGFEFLDAYYDDEDKQHYWNTKDRYVEASMVTHKYVMDSVPALRAYPFVSSMKNYYSMMDFELVEVAIPGQIVQNYASDWNKLSRGLNRDIHFGLQLKKTSYASDFLKPLMDSLTDKHELMKAVFEHVQSKIKWNGYYGVLIDDGFRKAYKRQKGNVAEINLMLVALLRKAGVQCNPLVLSTRDNGYLYNDSPSYQSLNYVIACAEIEGEEYMLDATGPYIPVGELPYRCYTISGYLLKNEMAYKRCLYPKQATRTSVMGQFNIDHDTFQGNLTISVNRDEAINMREKLVNENNHDEILDQIESQNPGFEIEDYKFENVSSITKPLNQKYSISIDDLLEESEGMLSFSPILYSEMILNPFDQDERKLPVDFGSPRDFYYVFSYTIPEDYQIVQLPKASVVSLPEQGGKYTYNVSASGNNIQCMSRLKINKAIYTPDDYFNLKALIDMVVEKQKERIVLKRKG